MKDSFRRIDYSIRPAKHAERKMLSEIFRRLVSFDPIEMYRYVGFGSVWFSDFLLFHRTLGVKDMLSIEQSTAARERFEANKPFNIRIDFRKSNLVLPEMGYDKRQFIWLDYDDPITPEMLRDAAAVTGRIRSGSVLTISVQCHRAPDIAESDGERAKDANAPTPEVRFRTRFADFNVDPAISREDLGGWAFGTLSRSLIMEEIKKAVQARKLADPSKEIVAKQICSFEYEDGAKMTTLVVGFYSPEEEKKFSTCGFDCLEFLNGDDPVYIPTPKLTVKEFKLLESQLPLSPERALNIGSIPPAEADGFARMYRYFPNFAVVEG